jgi:hypothetical protein
MSNEVLMAIIVILSLAVAGLVAWIAVQKRRSRQLQARFGPEYDRAVHQHGSRAEAEAELKARTERVQKLRIVPLSRADADRFSERWRAAQARFVDAPESAISEADHLVMEVMQIRGYPVGDFEARAADVSVDHPKVVEHYRAAHEIALRNQRGEAETEDLRRAMVHYRTLFEEMIHSTEPEPVEVKR